MHQIFNFINYDVSQNNTQDKGLYANSPGWIEEILDQFSVCEEYDWALSPLSFFLSFGLELSNYSYFRKRASRGFKPCPM